MTQAKEAGKVTINFIGKLADGTIIDREVVPKIRTVP